MPRSVYKRKWANEGQVQVEKKIKIEEVEQTTTATIDPLNNLPSYEAQMDVAIRIFQTIVMNQQLVYPTTELENWIVDLNVPTFQLPRNLAAAACVVVFPRNSNGDGTTLYILAFCRKMRQCLLMNDDNQLFKVDANELFHSKHVMINMSTPRRVSGLERGIFPYQMSIQSLDTCLSGVPLYSPSRETLGVQ